jgi:hypothetical protein
MKEQLPAAPADLEMLTETLVTSGQQLAAIGKDHIEAKKTIADVKNKVEEELISALDNAGGGLQCVSLRDAYSGTSEDYYLRIKAARKPQRKRLTVSAYRKMLRKIMEGELKQLNVSGMRAIEHICQTDTGSRICEAVRNLVRTRQVLKGGARRVSLDKVRSVRHTQESNT